MWNLVTKTYPEFLTDIQLKKKKKKKKIQIQESSKKIYVNIKNQVIYLNIKKIFLISYLNFKSLTYFLTNYSKSFAFIIRRNQCSCHI